MCCYKNRLYQYAVCCQNRLAQPTCVEFFRSMAFNLVWKLFQLAKPCDIFVEYSLLLISDDVVKYKHACLIYASILLSQYYHLYCCPSSIIHIVTNVGYEYVQIIILIRMPQYACIINHQHFPVIDHLFRIKHKHICLIYPSFLSSQF